MADISIIQAHSLSPAQARAAAHNVADRMAREYDMVLEWVGDVLSFKRSGVSGRLILRGAEAQLHITLGFLFRFFAPRIEEQAAKSMKQVFGGEA